MNKTLMRIYLGQIDTILGAVHRAADLYPELRATATHVSSARTSVRQALNAIPTGAAQTLRQEKQRRTMR